MANEKDNSVLASLISRLKKEKKPIWKRVVHELSRPRRDRIEVNLSKIDLYGEEGATLLVPGTVLGSGSLSKKGITIAAFRFSETAKKIIKDSGNKTMTIDALIKSNPEGREILLLR